MSKLKKLCERKFQSLAHLNTQIDSGVVGAARAKREVIALHTDGRTKRERTQKSDKQYFCPNGHNLVR